MQAKQNRGNNNRQPTPSTSKQAEEVRLRVDHVRVSVTQPKALILNPSTLINLSEGLEEFIQPILPTEDSHIADLSLLFNSGWLFFFSNVLSQPLHLSCKEKFELQTCSQQHMRR